MVMNGLEKQGWMSIAVATSHHCMTVHRPTNIVTSHIFPTYSKRCCLFGSFLLPPRGISKVPSTNRYTCSP